MILLHTLQLFWLIEFWEEYFKDISLYIFYVKIRPLLWANPNPEYHDLNNRKSSLPKAAST